MKNTNLKEQSNEELLKHLKKLKNYKIINTILTGFVIGILVYMVAKKGFSIQIILPLLILGGVAKSSRDNKKAEEEVLNEMNARGLQ